MKVKQSPKNVEEELWCEVNLASTIEHAMSKLLMKLLADYSDGKIKIIVTDDYEG